MSLYYFYDNAKDTNVRLLEANYMLILWAFP